MGKKDIQKFIYVHKRQAQHTEWTAPFQTGGHSATLIEDSSNIYFTCFLF